MTKEERAARKAYRPAFAKALAAAAKPTRFATANGGLYADCDGWFVAVAILFYPDRLRTRLVAQVKPMAIDPIFWDAMDTGEDRRRPLWKRHTGLALRDPPFASCELDDNNDAEGAALQALDQAGAWAAATADMTLADYLARCRAAETRPFHCFGSIATTLIAMGRAAEAQDLCRAATAAGNSGGYTAGTHNLVERLAEVLARG